MVGNRLNRFRREEDGITIVLFLVSLPVFVALSLLAIDVGRGNNLHYDLQKSVDALALAAAAELNRSPSAIVRANAAISGAIANGTRFSKNGTVDRLGLDLGNVTVTYLCELPADDDDPIDTRLCINGGHVTNDPLQATYAWVRAIDDDAQPFETLFPVSTSSGPATLSFSAESVAGYIGGVCNFPPIFICDPFENDPSTSLYDLLPSSGHALEGAQIEMRMKGGNDQPFPGNFGFLSDSGGASELGDKIAKADPGLCYDTWGYADSEPGNMSSLDKAINVRFGRYKGDYKDDNPDYVPALNVRTGYEPACNKDEHGTVEEGFTALGRDSQLTSMQGGNIGNGDWNFEEYWNINHPSWGGNFPNGWSNSSPPTRYEVYRYEIDPDGDGNFGDSLAAEESLGPDGAPGGGDGEVGTPMCHNAAVTPTDVPDRRLIGSLVVNCIACAADPSGDLCQGGRTGIPTTTFAHLFITEAVEQTGGGSGSDDILRVEVVDLPGPEGFGTLDDHNRSSAVLFR